MKYFLIMAAILVIGVMVYTSCATRNNGFKTVSADEFSKLINSSKDI